jgi:DNA repair exonuclease SbcCD nuclease subunit
MKILVLGDPHVNRKNLPIYSAVFEEIYELISEHKPNLFISLGDSLDFHERIELKSLCAINEFYIRISKMCKVVILIGNHDRENNRDFMSDIHPFTALIGQPNITIVHKTIYEEIDGNKFIYVPYVPNGKFHDALASIDYYPITFISKDSKDEKVSKVTPHIIFAHQEFKGAKLAENIVSTKGDPWSTNLPFVISGHLHDYSQLNNIMYIGTPFQHDYDENPDKALALIDIDVSKNIFTIKRIPLKTITKKITINLTPETLPNFASMLPPNNAVSGKDVDLKGKTLVKAVITIDSNDVKVLKTNEFYRSLCDTVDKVDLKITNGKTNIASSFLQKVQGNEEKVVTLEEIIKAMIGNDEYTLNIFNKLC